MRVNRRSVIRYASLAAAGNAAGLRPFGALNALAQSGTDYKALVCVFLYGGNEANNLLVPIDATGYTNYSTIHGPLALLPSQLQDLNSLPGYALHANLKEMATLFDDKAVALVANVGTLTQPTTKMTY
jgi:uncharacterized protein (DUF1501 family)